MKTPRETLEETEFETLGAMMMAYAAEAVRVARVNHRVRLDYSPVSIAELDGILDEQAAVDMGYQTKTWGGYLGEVMRKRWGGEWLLTQYPSMESLVPTLEIRGSRLYPLMKVWRRLTMGRDEGLMDFLIKVAERLDAPKVEAKPAAEGVAQEKARDK